jgi:hypothetical protein
MFGQTVFGFYFIRNADCKNGMLDLQQFTKLSLSSKAHQCVSKEHVTSFISIFGYNIIIWAIVGEML